MVVSSNSIFHFTKKIEILKKVLKAGHFKISYCLETYKIGESTYQIGVPMVSFCDLPLALANSHIKSYGAYSIGLTKQWAKSNGLNPVLYMSPNSNASKMLQPYLIDVINGDEFKDIRVRYQMTEVEPGKVLLKDVFSGSRGFRIDAFVGLLSFMKNYEGELWRKGKMINPKYKFYDEREWRFVPSFDDIDKTRVTYPQLMDKSEYEKWRSDDKEKPFMMNIQLDFQAKDISYIILKYERQISPCIAEIEKMNHLYKSVEEKRLLISRLYSTEKIKEDL